eukprot:403357791
MNHPISLHEQQSQLCSNMTYYQQAVYAIELFIQKRRQQNDFKFDKYFLFKTLDLAQLAQQSSQQQQQQLQGQSQIGFPGVIASGMPSQFQTHMQQQQQLQHQPTQSLFQQQLQSSHQQQTLDVASKHQMHIDSFQLSGCEHSYRHFFNQLMNSKNSRDLVGDMSISLKEIMRVVNSNRFLYGSDNRIYGIQTTRVEPTNVIVFTANPKFKNIEEFLKQSSGKYMFDEIFQWDQKLHIINFREVKNQEKLINLCEHTGGSYHKINEFHQLKDRILFIAENSLFTFTCKLKLQNDIKHNHHQRDQNCEDVQMKEPKKDGEYKNRARLYFDISQNVKNLDKLKGQNQQYQHHGGIYFGSTYPSFIILQTPVELDLSKTNSEILHINDPQVIKDLAEKILDPFNYQDEKLNSLGWLVHCEGETQNYPFALLKVIRNKIFQEWNKESESQQLLTMLNVPYFMTIQVMPLNFVEFWPLINNISDYKSVSQGYEKTKWKLAYQKYIEKLPTYYNEYINSYLKYLQAGDLLLPQTDKIYFSNNQILSQAYRELKTIQSQQESSHEQTFMKCKDQHNQIRASYSCCQNLQNQKLKSTGQDKQSEASYVYSLINDRDQLITQTMWQFTQVTLETFAPIKCGVQAIQQKISPSQQSSSVVPITTLTNLMYKRSNKNRRSQSLKHKGKQNQFEHKDIYSGHQQVIAVMSEYDGVLRKLDKFRYPSLSDSQNQELYKVYFGNPFRWNLNKKNLNQNEMQYDERTLEGGVVGIGSVSDQTEKSNETSSTLQDEDLEMTEIPKSSKKQQQNVKEQIHKKKQLATQSNSSSQQKPIQSSPVKQQQITQVNDKSKTLNKQQTANTSIIEQLKQIQQSETEQKQLYQPDINQAELKISQIRQQYQESIKSGNKPHQTYHIFSVTLNQSPVSRDQQLSDNMRLPQYLLQNQQTIVQPLLSLLSQAIDSPYENTQQISKQVQQILLEVREKLDKRSFKRFIGEIEWYLKEQGYAFSAIDGLTQQKSTNNQDGGQQYAKSKKRGDLMEVVRDIISKEQ